MTQQFEKGVAPYTVRKNKNYILDEIKKIKTEISEDLFVLGHYYQQSDVLRFADAVGDSYLLARYAVSSRKPYLVFCGVHFMAESADLLNDDKQIVLLPDLNAGCAMADMAAPEDAEKMWAELKEIIPEKIIPITYINSSAAIKAFVGKNGGAVCTSANADKVFAWALEKGDKLIFLPDRYLGWNTALAYGIDPDLLVHWTPGRPLGANSADALRKAKIILWNAYCSVHRRFLPGDVIKIKESYPEIKIAAHLECRPDLIELSHLAGSTSAILKGIEASNHELWAVATEQHFVSAIQDTFPQKTILPLAGSGYECTTMSLINPDSLLATLQSIQSGQPKNIIRVEDSLREHALIALKRMMEISN
ncbi:MAG TPA: quinolinate synthase NadA [Candidatus Marinimicrobia bacterium]|nr:quinolinate synthase NadA [Candidatus Neomarinimicrobiota bacterium]